MGLTDGPREGGIVGAKEGVPVTELEGCGLGTLWALGGCVGTAVPFAVGETEDEVGGLDGLGAVGDIEKVGSGTLIPGRVGRGTGAAVGSGAICEVGTNVEGTAVGAATGASEGATVGASLGRGVGASLVGCNDGVALGDVSDARVKGASTRSPWIDLKTYAR